MDDKTKELIKRAYLDGHDDGCASSFHHNLHINEKYVWPKDAGEEDWISSCSRGSIEPEQQAAEIKEARKDMLHP